MILRDCVLALHLKEKIDSFTKDRVDIPYANKDVFALRELKSDHHSFKDKLESFLYLENIDDAFI